MKSDFVTETEVNCCNHCEAPIRGPACRLCLEKRTCWRCGAGIMDGAPRTCYRCVEGLSPQCCECGEALMDTSERREGTCWRCQDADYWMLEHLAGEES